MTPERGGACRLRPPFCPGGASDRIRRWISVFTAGSAVWLLLSGSAALAQNIVVTGDWYLTIDATCLLGGPGSDVSPAYSSAADQINVDISRTNRNWGIYVRRMDSIWPPDVKVGLLRTANGKGSGWISGGTSWIEVTPFDQQFFIGYKQRRNIKVQGRVTGISVRTPSDTFSTTVVYTITDI